MPSFADSAATFMLSRPDADSRRAAWAAFEAHGLPTASDEVWRYAPLGELSLDSFDVPTGASDARESEFARALGERSGLVVRVNDGFVTDMGATPDGVVVESVSAGQSVAGVPLMERYGGDAFGLLNVALGPATTVIRVAEGVTVAQPLVVRHVVGATTAFPRTVVDLARGASATVVEYFEGGADALVVPLSEFRLGPDSSLHLITYQRLDHSAWHIARSTAFVERDARMRQAVLGMGSHYDRSRNDAELMEAGSENVLGTTFLGSGSQVHDFRTRQYHLGARSRSTLLSKGAVAGSSRSVYTGLIEIEKGAKRTDARQTNHNLLLSPTAHADSVPNLDIRENDVMCAHASSVGPLDELQLWYLESRGVEPDEAQRLIIQGFFTEMLTELPRELADLVEADVSESLSRVRST
ncbi:MAG TPA: Fe-S cluster assembly protein SufD [Acidimicrobiales bacterium]|nr:Fe-S cluster assembly protein SufD [Acidimicrobiales bacterium]